MNMLANYFPVIVAFLLAVGTGVGILIAARFIGWRKPSEEKEIPFECGNIPLGDAKIQFSVKFYLTALLFLIFDMETIFILLWAVSFSFFKENGVAVFMLVEMAVFIAILLVGYVYVWRRGGFSWS